MTVFEPNGPMFIATLLSPSASYKDWGMGVVAEMVGTVRGRPFLNSQRKEVAFHYHFQV